jgi:crotonobetainyl-CoA:carnitine CoA-transferase CaiB-like acyl-CoA transferase
VTVDGNTDWIKLATAIGRDDLARRPDLSTAEGRLTHREELDRAVEAWIAPLEPHDTAAQLQVAGVAAGAAVHVKDLLDDPQLAHRHALGQLPQPGWDEPLTVETGIALFDAIAPPALNPAPVMAQHTRWVCQTILELSDAEIDQLAEGGILELSEGPKGRRHELLGNA